MIRRSWMTGASIERTLELWALSLREVKSRMRPLFAQERAALNAGLFVDGLLGDERRKTGWMRAEAAGDPGPWRQQAVLGRDRWDADALRDLVRDYVTEHLADENAVLVIDETGFLKQGKASCGVARSSAAIYWFGGQNYELSDRCFCCLRVAFSDIVAHHIAQSIGIPPVTAQNRLLPPWPRIARRLRPHPSGFATLVAKQTVHE